MDVDMMTRDEPACDAVEHARSQGVSRNRRGECSALEEEDWITIFDPLDNDL
jgi:hypothetical protein